MQRVQIHPLIQVPDQLPDNPTYKFDRSWLLPGHVVNRYNNVGTMIVAHVQQKNSNSVPNNSQVVGMAFNFPQIITFHQSDVIQVYNIESKQCDQYQQERDNMSGTRCVLADNKVIIGVGMKKLMIWDRDTMLREAPRSVELEGAPAITSINDQKSAILPENKVLLVNNNPGGHLFQVWDYIKGELILYAENPSKAETAYTFTMYKDIIVTSVKETLHIWNLAPKGALHPVSVKFPESIVTAVHVDKHFLIVGDNFGSISMHGIDGRLIYHLNRVKHASENTVKDVELTKLSALFKSRVNRIQRVGRWVVCAFENSKVEIFDIFSANLSSACDSYVHQVPAAVRDFVLHESRIYLSVTVTGDPKTPAAKTAKHKPEIVIWLPKLEFEGFEMYADNPDLGVCSAIEILVHGCAKLRKLLPKLETSIRPDDLKPLDSTLGQIIPLINAVDSLQNQHGLLLPFLIFQKVQEDIDSYESYIQKISRLGVAATVRLGKIRERLDEVNGCLQRTVQMMINTAEFLGDVKKRVGVTKPSAAESGTASAETASSELVVPTEDSAGAKSKASLRKKKLGADDDDAEDAIDDLLTDVMESLNGVYETLGDQVDHYDQVCTDNTPEPDKLMPMLNIYSKLKQMTEDVKETAKTVGELHGDDASGEWWEGGGSYDEEPPAPATTVAPAASASTTASSTTTVTTTATTTTIPTTSPTQAE